MHVGTQHSNFSLKQANKRYIEGTQHSNVREGQVPFNQRCVDVCNNKCQMSVHGRPGPG